MNQKPVFGGASPVDYFEGGDLVPINFDQYLKFLIENGFLLMDVLYLPSFKLKKKKYNKNSYPNLIRTFFPLNIEVLKKLEWSPHLRIKVAYPITCRMLCTLFQEESIKKQLEELKPELAQKLLSLKPTDFIANPKYAIRLQYEKLIPDNN